MVQYITECNENKVIQKNNKTPKEFKPYAQKKLIVMSDVGIDTLFTDKGGYLKTKWNYGTYLLFEPWKFYKQVPTNLQNKTYDKDCLEALWSKEDLKIVVSKKTTTIANNIILITCPDQYPCLAKKVTQ